VNPSPVSRALNDDLPEHIAAHEVSVRFVRMGEGKDAVSVRYGGVWPRREGFRPWKHEVELGEIAMKY
jgi:hypothetical protein